METPNGSEQKSVESGREPVKLSTPGRLQRMFGALAVAAVSMMGCQHLRNDVKDCAATGQVADDKKEDVWYAALAAERTGDSERAEELRRKASAVKNK